MSIDSKSIVLQLTSSTEMVVIHENYVSTELMIDCEISWIVKQTAMLLI